MINDLRAASSAAHVSSVPSAVRKSTTDLKREAHQRLAQFVNQQAQQRGFASARLELLPHATTSAELCQTRREQGNHLVIQLQPMALESVAYQCRELPDVKKLNFFPDCQEWLKSKENLCLADVQVLPAFDRSRYRLAMENTWKEEILAPAPGELSALWKHFFKRTERPYWTKVATLMQHSHSESTLKVELVRELARAALPGQQNPVAAPEPESKRSDRVAQLRRIDKRCQTPGARLANLGRLAICFMFMGSRITYGSLLRIGLAQVIFEGALRFWAGQQAASEVLTTESSLRKSNLQGPAFFSAQENAVRQILFKQRDYDQLSAGWRLVIRPSVYRLATLLKDAIVEPRKSAEWRWHYWAKNGVSVQA